MDTLGKFKTNFLSDRSSFKIGFNNRSPLSQVGYKAKYVAPGSTVDNPDFSSQIPKSGSSLNKDGNSILAPSNEAALAAGDFIGDSIAGAGEELADSIGKNIERKKLENKIKEAEEKKKQEALNKVKKGSFAHKTLNPEGYKKWIEKEDARKKEKELFEKEKEKEAEESKRKKTLEDSDVPDFSGFTGTSDDWH